MEAGTHENIVEELDFSSLKCHILPKPRVSGSKQDRYMQYQSLTTYLLAALSLLMLCQACELEDLDITTIEEEEVPVDTIVCDLVASILLVQDSSDGDFLSVTVQGGIAPLSFIWSTGEDVVPLPVSSSGLYTVTVTDADSCTATAQFDHMVTDSCSGFEIIAIDVLISSDSSMYFLTPNFVGGVGPFAYLWSEGSSDQAIVTTLPGSYSVTITDSQGCTDTEEVDF